MSKSIDDVASLTLEQLGHALSTWRSECLAIARLIVGHYRLDGVKLWMIGNGTGEGDQDWHVMILAPDGRVLDPLYWQARHGLAPEDCGDRRPFRGTREEWGRGRGFDATLGLEMAVSPPLVNDSVRRILGR